MPLLVSIEPLEQVAKASTENTRCVLITTYERDSIWHQDAIVLIGHTDVETETRIVQVRGRRYRYQEISASEVLKLLMKPMGTIPISRPMLPRADVPGPTLEELIDDFRKAK
ncbi:hypothetical protein P8935_15290 [Telmatobacter sp. DSM 110680]|uniref:Uncharacterized protein n=1 Tax=Telmatobacter sp. DSM 110680 TaxID=3036704 RepID=A0AAU7DF17_9BACT